MRVINNANRVRVGYYNSEQVCLIGLIIRELQFFYSVCASSIYENVELLIESLGKSVECYFNAYRKE